MYVVLAFALLLIPMGTLFLLERLARDGKGPLADPARMILLDGTIVPALAPFAPPFAAGMPEAVRPVDDDEACSAESRLVAALLGGDLNRAEYQERMADLAASDAAVNPVRLPPARPGA